MLNYVLDETDINRDVDMDTPTSPSPPSNPLQNQILIQQQLQQQQQRTTTPQQISSPSINSPNVKTLFYTMNSSPIIGSPQSVPALQTSNLAVWHTTNQVAIRRLATNYKIS